MTDQQTTLAAQVFVLFQPVLAAVATALAGYITLWIRSKVKNETAAGVVDRSKDLLFALVKRANQTVVDKIREAAADGVITDQEKAAIKAAVVDDFKALVGVDGLSAIAYAAGISNTAGSLDKWIDTHVEAAVHDVKMLKAAAERTTDFPSAPPKP